MKRPTDYVTDNLQQSGNVLRYSSWPTIQQQTVGNHCWQVYRIHCDIFGMPRADVAYYIMHHDSEELITGDPPFPVKRDNPDLKAAFQRVEVEARERLGVKMPCLTVSELDRVKVCDLLEMTVFGMSEREMGNMLAIPIIQRTSEGAIRLAHDKLPEQAALVLEWFRAQWRRHQSVIRQGDISAVYNFEV